LVIAGPLGVVARTDHAYRGLVAARPPPRLHTRLSTPLCLRQVCSADAESTSSPVQYSPSFVQKRVVVSDVMCARDLSPPFEGAVCLALL